MAPTFLLLSPPQWPTLEVPTQLDRSLHLLLAHCTWAMSSGSSLEEGGSVFLLAASIPAQEGQDLGSSAHGQVWAQGVQLSASFRLSPARSPASQVSLGGGLGSVSFCLHRPTSQFPRLACPHLIPWTRSGHLCPSWWSRPRALAPLQAHPFGLVAPDGSACLA